MEKLLSEYMLSLGLMPNMIGYQYIYTLIINYLDGKEILPLKLCGYKLLHDKYNKSIWSIDKNIQNCISKAWLCGNIDYLYKEFGNTIDLEKGKPTSKQLIMHIYQKMQLLKAV